MPFEFCYHYNSYQLNLEVDIFIALNKSVRKLKSGKILLQVTKPQQIPWASFYSKSAKGQICSTGECGVWVNYVCINVYVYVTVRKCYVYMYVNVRGHKIGALTTFQYKIS